ncbi:hypothetical protein SYNPS1DRAFT_27719 [Syncephalis pseudoplumigaleata]|uniref:Nucleic acid-binding protein n=1 Tax=Syncephalis pseudoplumigaleata TaxID=1712513 RepID=A0A4P9Z452_9FUNG|nr:hypothetical protein SYNPS1DRAFT_27719 [Syncephalis pseudoplumigaleata]|eukprot:RKP26601.1 hypothetical protein SYNPS1DRAFT_27719 [Syncephalis pseudoplumigaleata]
MFLLRTSAFTRLAGARSFSATAAAANLSYNRATLLGNVVSDLRLQELNENRTIVDFTLATNRYHRNREGETVQETDWHRIRTFVTPARANLYNDILKKGNVVLVEGSIRYAKYMDKEGTERKITNILADKVQNMGEYRRHHREESAEEGSGSSEEAY